MQQEPPLPFDKRFFTQTVEAMHKLLSEIPELDGVAVVPIWHIQNERIPAGVVMGKHGALTQPTELIKMCMALLGCLDIQVANARKLVLAVDTDMGVLARKSTQLLEEINVRQRQLAELDAAIAGRNATSQPYESAAAGNTRGPDQ